MNADKNADIVLHVLDVPTTPMVQTATPLSARTALTALDAPTVFLENATTELAAKTAPCACHALRTQTWISANTAKSHVKAAPEPSDASMTKKHLPNFSLVMIFSLKAHLSRDTHSTKDSQTTLSEETQSLMQKTNSKFLTSQYFRYA